MPYWPKRYPTKRERERKDLGGFRSGFEKRLAEALTKQGIKFEYESEKILYVIPETEHSYTPDFIFGKRKGGRMYIELKGRFKPEDRKKHLLIQEQRPDLDIRFIFWNARAKIYKGSKTTHEAWAKKNNFLYAHRTFPGVWLKEL